ncbi:hypothetical protein J3Q64DRAFT_1718968 [Phycomyces blakesleeanus]|uniref:Uncharacterized protein n=1 Tax=Phycomyces blakesleeanus TaxID=4837 RepID=A0ABR3B969_PHYBL
MTTFIKDRLKSRRLRKPEKEKPIPNTSTVRRGRGRPRKQSHPIIKNEKIDPERELLEKGIHPVYQQLLKDIHRDKLERQARVTKTRDLEYEAARKWFEAREKQAWDEFYVSDWCDLMLHVKVLNALGIQTGQVRARLEMTHSLQASIAKLEQEMLELSRRKDRDNRRSSTPTLAYSDLESNSIYTSPIALPESVMHTPYYKGLLDPSTKTIKIDICTNNNTNVNLSYRTKETKKKYKLLV